jgi:hypothetical protein
MRDLEKNITIQIMAKLTPNIADLDNHIMICLSSIKI